MTLYRRFRSVQIRDGYASRLDAWQIPVSFEANEDTAVNRLYVPWNITITKMRGTVQKAIAATEDGTITLKNAAGSTAGTMTAASGATLGADLTPVTPTTNNTISAGSYFTLTPNKTTDGGKVLVTVEFTRTSG